MSSTSSPSCGICGALLRPGMMHLCGGTPTRTVADTLKSGWRCPVCNSGVSPWMAYCPGCAQKASVASPGSSATGKDEGE